MKDLRVYSNTTVKEFLDQLRASAIKQQCSPLLIEKIDALIRMHRN